MRRYFLLTSLILLSSLSLFAQQIHSEKIQLNWTEDYDRYEDEEAGYQSFDRPVWCKGCYENIVENTFIPSYSLEVKTVNARLSNVSIKNVLSHSIEREELKGLVQSDFDIKINKIRVKGEIYSYIHITPLRYIDGQLELLDQFEINYTLTPENNSITPFLYKKDQTYNSVLSTGTNYKISVSNSGVHKITKDFLNAAGISSSNIKLSTFNIYGNGGKMLSEIIAEPRAEDLRQNALYIYDENKNDILDAPDYILWYAQGPHFADYNFANSSFSFSYHDYSSKAYYFLQWGTAATLLIDSADANQGLSPDRTITNSDFLLHHEDNQINHIHSGRIWWGDEMSGSQLVKNFNYSVAGLDMNAPLRLQTITSARSLSTSYINIKLNNSETNVVHSQVSGKFDANYTAGSKFSSITDNPVSENISVTYSYSKPLSDSKAWIDYFDLIGKRKLQSYSGQFNFFNTSAAVNGNSKYQIENATNYWIWNVTDPGRPLFQLRFAEGGLSSFIVQESDNNLQRFVLFRPEDALEPEFVGGVDNQNIHGLSDIEYIIVSYPDFKEEAERLADFHRQTNNLQVVVVTTTDIFNEFSSGSQDVTAIRDFVKLIYDRGQNGSKPLKYLLLFGDASYDFKNVIANNTNFVPIYQSFNSFLPAETHCSDDYYAILDDDEGYWGLSPKFEGLDIGVGRLPVGSLAEAKLMVDKIMHYHSSQSFGNWTQRLSFLGDDEDTNVHLECSEHLTNIVRKQNKQFNINKLWMDAYEQVSFGSGNKYPEVNTDVDKVINQGTLIFNYVGHGGGNGMAHERVVTRPQITEWTNANELSFYITASCELASIDNPAQKSPGELMLFNPKGGAIGMVATTRVVYIGANCDLNEDILNDNIFNLSGDRSKPLGEVYQLTRNRANSGQVINKRSFMLFADPAMSLLRAPNKVITTKINGVDYNTFSDTLKALSKVTIEGEIRNPGNTLLSNFNGVLYPTIYDKFATYQTRANDPKSLVANFEAQNSVIYKGKTTVTNGKFSFSFVIPKDIAYHYGLGKLSYYANDEQTQAAGFDTTIMVGGTTDNLANDQLAPELSMFIDDESWVFGGTTDRTPLLLANIYDENGINTVGSGIGREMEAILDEGTDNETSIVLNEYFEPELNSYQRGKINYTFEELGPGKHSVRLKVWDVYNNAAESYTEFIVADKEGISIEHLLNYPNPFNKFTTFHFDHNKAGQNLVLSLTIYTVSGKVVKSLSTTIMNADAHSADLSWDGLDDFGDPIGQGVYMYVLEAKAEDGSTEKQTQKLYILK